MKRLIKSSLLRSVAVAMLLALSLVSVNAHILTETSQFPDIKTSDARFDIIVLVAAGIVPETSEFGPDKNLTRTDLAAWGAQAASLLGKVDKPDVNALARAALEQGMVKSLDGDATYTDINALFFNSKDQPAQPDAVPTRAQAATYLAKGLTAPVPASLLEKSGLHSGPVGAVASVESKTNPDGGSSYYLTIGDTTLPMYTHAKVGNGPSDIAKWKGMVARRTFVRKLGDISVWAYLEAETVEGKAAEPAHEHGSHMHAE
jgi:hypothetical protein